MEKFLSCDWGTSSFRLRLINADDLRILEETTHHFGIADTYHRWTQQAKASLSRSAFYEGVLREWVDGLGRQSGTTLDDIPIVLSGMASSSIGMVELPYKQLPFDLDGKDILAEVLTDGGSRNPIILVSGVRTEDDVMRGEETKVLGCSAVLEHHGEEQLLILPGTHPKHITVMGHQAVDFSTYMTGEFFNLLSTNSVLSASVESGAAFGEPEAQRWFREGVETGSTSGILQAAFKVRTNQLLKHIPKAHNFYYLSGLLVGAELRNVNAAQRIYLITGKVHRDLYKKALHILDIPIAGELDADLALIRGQQVILSRLLSR